MSKNKVEDKKEEVIVPVEAIIENPTPEEVKDAELVEGEFNNNAEGDVTIKEEELEIDPEVTEFNPLSSYGAETIVSEDTEEVESTVDPENPLSS